MCLRPHSVEINELRQPDGGDGEVSAGWYSIHLRGLAWHDISDEYATANLIWFPSEILSLLSLASSD